VKPNGTHIVFVRTRERVGSNELRYTRPRGGNMFHVVHDTGIARHGGKWAASAAALAVGICSGSLQAQRPQCVGELPSQCFVVKTSGEGIFVPGTNSLAISPDGRFVVYVGATDSGTRLYVIALGDSSARPLVGTEGAARPMFSFDGNWIAFVAAGELRKIGRGGSRPIALARGVPDLPITWTADNTIILPTSGFMRGSRRGLSRISPTGGAPTTLTVSDSIASKRHWNPLLLSDSTTLLFVDQGPGGAEDDYLAIGSGAGGDFTVLDLHAAKPLGYAHGHVVYSADGKIMGVPVDLERRARTGDPVVLMDGLLNNYDISLAWNGTLVYANSPAHLVWVDEKGAHETVMDKAASNYQWPRLSPDGSEIAVTISDATSWDVWVHNTITRRLVPLDTRGGERPEWTPDGKRVIYMLPGIAGTRSGLWSQPVDGSGPPERVNGTLPGNLSAEGVISPDGRTLLFRIVTGVGGRDLYYSTIGGSSIAKEWLATRANEITPRFSPDGQWVAYASDESGRYEVYVRSFLGHGRPYKISDAGGAEPVWSRDGRRIYYRSGAQMMVSDVRSLPGFAVISRKSLFAWRGVPDLGHANYDVAADGKLLMVLSGEQDSGMVVIRNWADKLRAKVPPAK